MIDFLQSHFAFVGNNVYARWTFVIELLIAEIMFAFPWRRRNRFALRAALCLAVYVGIGMFLPDGALGAYVTYLIFALSVFLNFVVFDYKIEKIIFNCAGAYGFQGLITNFSVILRNLFPAITASYRPLVDLALTAIIYTIAWFLCARHDTEISIKRIRVVIICLLTLLTADLMSKIVNSYGGGNVVIYRLSLSISVVLALLYQYSSFREGRLGAENRRMEELLKAGQEQYRISRESIDLVNRKCHDLKHQLVALREGVAGDKSEILKEMEQAVLFYEHVVNTGNNALDTVLTEKSLFCESNNINFTCIADGGKLDFMKPSDLYSLMGNAISNAIESVMREDDEEKRIIFLNVFEKQSMLCVHLENYCAAKPVFSDGLPVTTKADRENHGIGTKSIRYIADKYGGSTVFGFEEDLFSMDITFPLNDLSAS